MKKLIYVEEKYLDPFLCEPFKLIKRNDQNFQYGDVSRGGGFDHGYYLTDESLEWDGCSRVRGNYGAIYVDSVVPSEDSVIEEFNHQSMQVI